MLPWQRVQESEQENSASDLFPKETKSLHKPKLRQIMNQKSEPNKELAKEEGMSNFKIYFTGMDLPPE